MKTHLTTLLCLVLPAALAAQEPPPPVVQASAEAATDNTLLTAEQLDQLLGPIALYPDALIAIILPASTVPGDIAIASRYVRNSGDLEAVSGRAWEESVKSLAHYPEVLNWMDENLDWTKQLGEAFREQPADVMNAVQRLRAKARAAGTLVDTPQQQVVVEQDVISVVPAQPDVIYVPYYDPGVVYSYSPAYYDYGYPASSFVSFSAGFAAGSWLVYDFDWRRRTLWTADRHWAARYGHDWRRPSFPGSPGYVADPHRRPWSPPTYLSHVSPTYRSRGYTRPSIVNPAPIASAPARPGQPPANRGNRDDWTNHRNAPSYAGPRSDPPQNRPTTTPPTGPNVPANAIPRVGGGRPRDVAGTPAPQVTGPAAGVAPAPASNLRMPSSPAPDNSGATQPAPRRGDFNGRNQYADRSNRTTPPPQATAPAPQPSAPTPAPVVTPPPAQRYNARYMGPQAAPSPAPSPSYSAPAPSPTYTAPAPTYTPPAPSQNPRMHMPQQNHTPAPAPAPAPQPVTQPAAPQPPAQPTAQPPEGRQRNNPDNERRRAQN